MAPAASGLTNLKRPVAINAARLGGPAMRIASHRASAEGSPMTDRLPDNSASVDPDLTRAQPSGIKAAEVIGPYRLLERVGEGGMGEVWLAEQTQPIHRQVALKVIKAGMDTRRWWLGSRPSVRHWP